MSDSTVVGLFAALILACLAVRLIYTAWVAETTVRRVRRWRAESVRAAEEDERQGMEFALREREWQR